MMFTLLFWKKTNIFEVILPKSLNLFAKLKIWYPDLFECFEFDGHFLLFLFYTGKKLFGKK